MSYSKHRPLLFLGILLLTTVAVGCAVAVIPGVTRGVGATFSGHLWRAVPGGSGDITSDGELIVVLGSDPEYRDPETGARIYPNPDWGGLLGELPEWVRFSPDGELVAAAAGREGPGNHVRVWLVGDRNHLYEIAPLSEEPPQAAYAPLAFFSSDSRTLAINQGSKIRLYDAQSGILLDSIQSNLQEVNQIAFSRAGDVMVCGSYFDDLIEVWDMTMRVLVDSIRVGDISPVEGDDGYAAFLHFTPDDTKLITGLVFRLGDDLIRRTVIWERRDYSVVETITGGSYLAFSPDNKHIAFHLSGLQRGDLIEEGRYELVNRYMVQIMTWPELKPLTAWNVPPAFRWLGWPDNSAVWVVSVVSGYTRGSHLGSMVRWELDLDLLHAGDTLPPSPAREITFD
ncbi:WD40 repeat domain-containing protein [Gemmatimonadota bacterium]